MDDKVVSVLPGIIQIIL